MTASVARAVLYNRQAKTILCAILAEVSAVAAVMIPLYGHFSTFAFLLAACLVLIAAGLAMMAFWTLRYIRRDLSGGKVRSVTGTIGLLDVSYPSGRFTELWLGPVNLRIGYKLADAIRRVASRKDNRLSFTGTVQYLPQSRMVLSIVSDPNHLVYRHPALKAAPGQAAQDSPPPLTDHLVAVPISLALVAILGFTGLVYLASLTGGSADLNCIGQSSTLAAAYGSDGATRFAGADSPDSLYYTRSLRDGGQLENRLGGRAWQDDDHPVRRVGPPTLA